MKKPNKLLSYGFGLVMGLVGLASSAKGQQNYGGVNNPTTAQGQGVNGADSTKKKEVTLAPELMKELNKTFNSTRTKKFEMSKVTYSSDSTAPDGAPNAQNMTIFEMRISDAEQIAITAVDNGDRVITKNEVESVLYGYTDNKTMHILQVVKGTPEPQDASKYHVMEFKSKNTNPLLQLDLDENYSDLTKWAVKKNSVWKTEEDIWKPFKDNIQKQNPAINYTQ